MTVTVTTKQAVVLLTDISNAFAQAWAGKDLVEGRASLDARDAVRLVREGTPPRKALLLLGFKIEDSD